MNNNILQLIASMSPEIFPNNFLNASIEPENSTTYAINDILVKFTPYNNIPLQGYIVINF